MFDEAGGRLTPTHCVKKGTRYRYYVSTALVTGAAKGGSPRLRIPAGNLERLVLDRLRTFLSNRAEILDAISHEPDSAALHRRLFERGRQIADELSAETPENARATVTNLICRVEIRADCIRIGIARARLTALLAAQSIDLPMDEENKPNDSADDILTIMAAAKLARVGGEMKMLIDGQDDTATADPSLLRVIARAHDIQERLTQDTGLSAHDIARQEQVSAAYIYTLLRLPWLAPDITTAIVNGKQPPQLSAKQLMRLTARLPIDWAEQRTLLGFAENKPSSSLNSDASRIEFSAKTSLHACAKIQPRNAPAEIFAVLRAGKSVHFVSAQITLKGAPRNTRQMAQYSAATTTTKTTTISMAYMVAGAPGFEPGNGGIKIRCLTTWLRPKTRWITAVGRPAGGP